MMLSTIFTVTVHRTTEKGSVKTHVSPEKIVLHQKSSGKGSEKSSEKILGLLSDIPEMTISQLAKEIGISTRAIEKQIAKLQKSNRLKRIGSAKGAAGHVNGITLVGPHTYSFTGGGGAPETFAAAFIPRIPTQGTVIIVR